MAYRFKQYTSGAGVEEDMNKMEEKGWVVVSTAIRGGGDGFSSYSVCVTYHKSE